MFTTTSVNRKKKKKKKKKSTTPLCYANVRKNEKAEKMFDAD